MSPVAKNQRPPLSDAQIFRWLKTHYSAWAGEQVRRGDQWPFSKLVALVDRFANDVSRLQQAMRDPTAPGAAEIIRDIYAISGDDGERSLAYHAAEIECYGDAIAWGLRGEPQDEIDAFHEKRARDREAYEKAKKRGHDPAWIERCTANWIERCTTSLIEAATKVEEGSPKRVLTRDERVAVVAKISEALLGVEQPQAPRRATKGER